MSRRQYDLLSFSVLILSVGACAALFATGFIRLLEVAPLVIVIMGVWLMILSAIRRGERRVSPFGIFSQGLILLVGGGMGLLYVRGVYRGFFIPALLIVLGLIGVLAAMRTGK
ncbi:MAG: hypothetical protein ACETVR_00355 [Candidatus Bathyarchaeia archaeon]